MVLKNKRGLETGACAICAAMVLFASAALAAANVPSIDQVYEAARGGHLAQAEAMTKEVLHAYPNSARAHYVMAQILAAEGRTSEARSYLEEAEHLKPGLPFASSESVTKLERRINGEAQLPVVAHPSTNQVHWWWLLVGAVFVFILWRALRGRRPALSDYSDRAIGAGSAGPGPSTPPAVGYSGWGGGLLSSVLAGLGFGAAAGAGERVMDHFLGREQTDEPAQPDIHEPSSGAGDLGGNVFGVQSGDSSSGGWEDSGNQTNASPGPDDDFGAAGSGDGGWDDSSGGGGDVDV